MVMSIHTACGWVGGCRCLMLLDASLDGLTLLTKNPCKFANMSHKIIYKYN